jgi:hypothetical protein
VFVCVCVCEIVRETARDRKDERETVSDRDDSERQTDIQAYRQCESE